MSIAGILQTRLGPRVMVTPAPCGAGHGAALLRAAWLCYASAQGDVSFASMSATPHKTLLEPGHEAEWAELNREKREYQQRNAQALSPSERVAGGLTLSRQAVQLLASTIRAGHVPPRAFWS